MKTRRFTLIENTTKDFVKEYFDQNPLCQIGLICLRNGIATKLCDLTGNSKIVLQTLSNMPKSGGEPSIQNGLEMALTSFSSTPSYGTKEILLLYSSLSTSDPSDIFESIEAAKKKKVRCSTIGIGSELYICKVLASETHGTYSVPLNEEHYKELVFDHTTPPPSSTVFRIVSDYLLIFRNLL